MHHTLFLRHLNNKDKIVSIRSVPIHFVKFLKHHGEFGLVQVIQIML